MTNTEDRLLAECHAYLWNTYKSSRYCCWHIANERKCTPQQGAILKSKGVIAGVPDYVINFANNAHYFEFKTDTGVLSNAQKLVHAALENASMYVHIIRNFEQFKEIVDDIFDEAI